MNNNKKYDSIISQLRSITHDHSDQVNKSYFNAHYGYPKISVVFKKAFQNMDIKTKWTKAYLLEKMKDKEAVDKLEDSNSREFMTLEDYFNLEQGWHYYFKTSRHAYVLKDDYNAPSIFNCWYANTKVSSPKNKLSWLYVGLTDTYSDLHRDLWNTSAWNFLISGKKLWIVYPEIYNSHIKTNKENYATKAVISDPEILLRQDITPMICIQEQGDLIYMPGNNYHAVINITETISLTENFINETNYDEVRNHFRKGKNKNNIAAIEAIVKEGFEQLELNIKN